MNKSMLMGVALGVGIATAGGVAAYQYLGNPAAPGAQGSAVVEPEVAPAASSSAESRPARTAPAPQSRATAAVRTAQPAARSAPAPAATAAAPAAQSAAAGPGCDPDAPAQPKDGKRIAGTTLGALIGGAVARDVGDRNLTTAVGAAVGAYAGNKIQQKIQERNAAGRPCAQ